MFGYRLSGDEIRTYGHNDAVRMPGLPAAVRAGVLPRVVLAMRRPAPGRRRVPGVTSVPGNRDGAGEHASGEPPAAGDDGCDRLEPRPTAGGRRVHVDAAAGTRGSRGAFYPAYPDRDRGRRFGCANGASTDVAMDPMGRTSFNRCGNRHEATRWDAAYL